MLTVRAEAPQWAVEGDGEQWQQREVALWVGAEAGSQGRSLDGLHGLLATLFEEERQAFHGAVQAATDACAALCWVVMFCRQQGVAASLAGIPLPFSWKYSF